MKKYDGCSGGMSWAWRFLFRKNPPWEGCCDVHDQPYAKGGTAQAQAEEGKKRGRIIYFIPKKKIKERFID